MAPADDVDGIAAAEASASLAPLPEDLEDPDAFATLLKHEIADQDLVRSTAWIADEIPCSGTLKAPPNSAAPLHSDADGRALRRPSRERYSPRRRENSSLDLSYSGTLPLTCGSLSASARELSASGRALSHLSAFDGEFSESGRSIVTRIESLGACSPSLADVNELGARSAVISVTESACPTRLELDSAASVLVTDEHIEGPAVGILFPVPPPAGKAHVSPPEVPCSEFDGVSPLVPTPPAPRSLCRGGPPPPSGPIAAAPRAPNGRPGAPTEMSPMMRGRHMDILDGQYAADHATRLGGGAPEPTPPRSRGRLSGSPGPAGREQAAPTRSPARPLGPDAVLPSIRGSQKRKDEAAKPEAREAQLKEHFRQHPSTAQPDPCGGKASVMMPSLQQRHMDRLDAEYEREQGSSKPAPAPLPAVHAGKGHVNSRGVSPGRAASPRRGKASARR